MNQLLKKVRCLLRGLVDNSAPTYEQELIRDTFAHLDTVDRIDVTRDGQRVMFYIHDFSLDHFEQVFEAEEHLEKVHPRFASKLQINTWAHQGRGIPEPYSGMTTVFERVKK